jgi:hypothetical protein
MGGGVLISAVLLYQTDHRLPRSRLTDYAASLSCYFLFFFICCFLRLLRWLKR